MIKRKPVPTAQFKREAKKNLAELLTENWTEVMYCEQEKKAGSECPPCLANQIYHFSTLKSIQEK